ncbi:Uncharacterized protein dnm_042530 [Desulfonema magnum]|uniref:Uncharacterized protein n=1 Tax=Desulfonema magnum TaxID=45655 RepID=A0A975GNQ5_9BACT|nr:Uncharacterized protein dnm_042530 [Desulfonema magnum]
MQKFRVRFIFALRRIVIGINLPDGVANPVRQSKPRQAKG